MALGADTTSDPRRFNDRRSALYPDPHAPLPPLPSDDGGWTRNRGHGPLGDRLRRGTHSRCGSARRSLGDHRYRPDRVRRRDERASTRRAGQGRETLIDTCTSARGASCLSRLAAAVARSERQENVPRDRLAALRRRLMNVDRRELPATRGSGCNACPSPYADGRLDRRGSSR